MKYTLLGAILAVYLVGILNTGMAAPAKIQFQGETFNQAFKDKSAAGPFWEYLPKGQTLEKWTKFMGYYEFTKQTDVKDAVGRLAEVVKQMNPDAQSEVLYNDASDEGVVDFVTWPKDNAYVEWNVWKYAKNPSGGLKALQYAERAYPPNVESFLKNLGKRRGTLRNAMIAQPW